MKHANIAIFVPHNGCTHQCSFCDQKVITGKIDQPTKGDVFSAVNVAKKYNERFDSVEIAFFGGSFTAIERSYMLELLDAASKCVKENNFSGIRISTRPDAINDEILKLLKERNVTAIELGAQSMDDKVLEENNRGHSANDVVVASKLIKKYGFSLGLQMMTGLYKSSYEKDIYTAKRLADLNPDTMRIYPTVIMKNTYLEQLYINKEYVPMGFNETVDLCSCLLHFFEEKNIPVIRLGLHDSKSLHENMVAGVWHPAFREICESNILLKKSIKLLKEENINSGNVCIYVNNASVSKMIGQKRCNIIKLKNMGYNALIKIDDNVKVNDIIIKKM